jgi:hypothetical protein
VAHGEAHDRDRSGGEGSEREITDDGNAKPWRRETSLGENLQNPNTHEVVGRYDRVRRVVEGE